MAGEFWQGSSGSGPTNLTPLGDSLLFFGRSAQESHDSYDATLWASNKGELQRLYADNWSTVSDFDAYNLVDNCPLTKLNDVVLLAGPDAEDRTRTLLWRSDGTPAGTVIVKDVALEDEPTGPGPIIPFGNFALFFAFTPEQGQELWRTDGTAAGTTLVKEVAPGPSYETRLETTVVLQSGLLFTVIHSYERKELWFSDGTAAGTRKLATLNATAAASGAVTAQGVQPPQIAMPDEYLCYGLTGVATAERGYFMDGRHLWISDGTVAGTKDLGDSGIYSEPAYLTNVLTLGQTDYVQIVASGWNDVGGQIIAATDGTPSGTRWLSSLESGWMAKLGDRIISIGRYNAAGSVQHSWRV